MELSENIRASALQFLRWAHTHGVLATDSYFPGETIGTPNFGDTEISPKIIGILRTRQIRFLGINPQENRITVFLKRTSPTVKEIAALPTTCNGFSVSYHQGNPDAIAPANISETTSACAIFNGASGLKYCCGSSISVGNNREAGTLGCLVRDAEGSLYGLSNNHVSGSCGYAPLGLPIIAPGVLDVSPLNPPPFTLGIHTRQLPLSIGDPTSIDHTQNSDAAIFQIIATGSICSMQRGHYDTPSSVMDIAPGMTVQKVGRTTDLTEGTVMGEIVGPTSIRYAAPNYEFSGHVYFEPLFVIYGNGDIFSDGGDSGSLVTHVDSSGARHAVGIVVGGAIDNKVPGGKLTLVLPLRPVLDRLSISLVSSYNL